MTKNERLMVFKRVSELLETHNHAVIGSVIRKLDSGGIDPEAFDLTDFSLPKILVTSALRDHVEDFVPVCKPWADATNNLDCF